MMMATSEERMRILKMVQEGKISAEEGARLLQALKETAPADRPRRRRLSGRWLRVHVTDERGRAKVNVNLPLRLVDAALGIAEQFVPEVEMAGIVDALDEAIQDGLMGKIVEVHDEEDGEHIEIFIE